MITPGKSAKRPLPFRRLWLCLLLLCRFGSMEAAGSLRINEVMASNGSTIADEDGDYEDWVELINAGDGPVDLEGWGLSDDPDRPCRWVFPAVTLDPGELLLVWASGKDRVVEPAGWWSSDEEFHTNFSIAAAGEDVLLTRPDGSLADALPPTSVPRDLSIGRLPGEGDAWFYFDQPTPGAPNTTVGYSEILDPPVFSHSGGFHTQDLTLSLTTADPEVTILYTLDGSTPCPDAVGGRTYAYKHNYPQSPDDPFGELLERGVETLVYEQPLPITNRSPEANRLSMLASTWHRNPDHYAPQEPIFKATPVRARAVREGALPSPVVTHTYFITPEGRERYSLPVISLVLDEDALFDYEYGMHCAGHIYDEWRSDHPTASASGNTAANYHMRGDQWEHPADLQLFERLQELPALHQMVGIRIHGGITRAAPRKSLRVYARNQYGENSLQHAFFQNADHKAEPVYRRLVLRNSGHDDQVWWATLFRDALIQRVVRHLDMDTQDYEPSILFINGEYWGIYNIRERYDRHYLSQMYGVCEDNVDLLTHRRSVKEGDSSHYDQTIAYIVEHGLQDALHFDEIETRIDINNFIDYQIAHIFARNTDWPGNNIDFWRMRTDTYLPEAPAGRDGRWRWLFYDSDFGFGLWGGDEAYTHDTLGFATQEDGPGWPNPPWSTFLLRSFLDNSTFRHRFVSRFADLINTAFLPFRIHALIDKLQEPLVPEIAEHIERWRSPASESAWNRHVDVMRTFAQHRPAHQRQHIVDHFDLAGQYTLTLNVADPAQGRLRVNTIDLCPERTPGVPDPAHPWSGIYFLGVPVTVTAIPEPGFYLDGWDDLPDGERPLERTLDPEGDLSVTVHFKAIPQPELLHYWSFNTRTLPPSPDHTHGGGTLMLALGPDTGVLYDDGQDFTAANSRLGEPAGEHLRLDNPLEATLELTLPTPGFQDIVLRYESRRSGQGAGLQQLGYTTNGTDFVDWPDSVELDDAPPVVYRYDFSGIPGVNDNPDFGVRITFAEGEGGAAGNNRFDNITLDGWALGANRPPRIEQQPPFQKLVARAGPLILDLDSVFSDPGGDALQFSVDSCTPHVVSPHLEGPLLTLSPLIQGDATVTLSASDGIHPPVATDLRVLVHPAPHAVAGGAFSFGHWSPDAPEGTFPDHMLFLQGEVSDPDLSTPLLVPYHVPIDEVHADDVASVGFPYRLTRRSRLSGLGDDGISFINTGRGRDLGAALLALDTTGASGIGVEWTGGTLLPNDRVYAIRVQARLGHDGSWTDLLDGEDAPVEYLRHETEGHAETLGPFNLPAWLENQPYIQLRWVYHHAGIDDGPRAELRLDDIAIQAAEWTLLRYDHWQARHFAPDAPDAGPLDTTGPGDLPNLLRYASDLSPDALPDAGLFRIISTPEGSPALRFYGDPDKSDLSYQVLATADLSAWPSTPIFDSRSPEGSGVHHEDRFFTLPLDTSDAPRRAFRLRIKWLE